MSLPEWWTSEWRTILSEHTQFCHPEMREDPHFQVGADWKARSSGWHCMLTKDMVLSLLDSQIGRISPTPGDRVRELYSLTGGGHTKFQLNNWTWRRLCLSGGCCYQRVWKLSYWSVSWWVKIYSRASLRLSVPMYHTRDTAYPLVTISGSTLIFCKGLSSGPQQS